MKLPVPDFSEESSALSLESCEDGLNILAYLIREDLAEGRETCDTDLDDTRKIAAELMAHASRCLAVLWSSPSMSGLAALLEPRLVRLLRAMRGALHPSTSRREMAESLQSVADLIRSTRKFERTEVPALYN
jgi:hypothetical protein